MTLSIEAVGAAANTTTATLSVAYPATGSAGTLYLFVQGVRSTTGVTITQPSGFNLLSTDSRSWTSTFSTATISQKSATGTETGTVSVTGNWNTGGGAARGFMFRVPIALSLLSTTAGWGFGNPSGAVMSVTADSGATAVVNDMFFAALFDTAGGTFSSGTIAETGVTFGTTTEALDAASGGWEAGLFWAVSSGGTSGSFVSVAANSTVTAVHNTQAALFRIRELAPQVDPVGMMGLFGV